MKRNSKSTDNSLDKSVEALRQKLVIISYSSKIDERKTIDKRALWDKAKLVGKNPILDDTVSQRPIHASH